MKIKDIIIVILIIAICILLVKNINYKTAEKEASNNTNEVLTDDNNEEIEKIKYIYQTKYVDFDFVSVEEKSEWKDALVSLLNNQKIAIYDEGKGIKWYSYLYPDRPCIENGYQLALFDINTDGIPELLVNVGGGSAGNAFYYVYDILSGKEIGTLDGGHSNSWCIYFNQLTGMYEAIGQFEWRSGWMGKIRLVHKATITHTMGGNDKYLHETSLMYAYYDINAVEIPLTKEEIENGIYSSWEEVYTGVQFRVNGDSASIEEYFEAQDNFIENYIRIVETGIQLIDWNDVTNNDDDVATKAEKMAIALISSEQQFVKSMSIERSAE